ncbi:hypothetical protein L1987_22596 [Smallanthus sonchifolius]|uniref:Uncharacterized protein n=1 Tax=Smallanthus sonchifolius TaxID=185202 RepID=A0ACB9IHY2_9ASTR|nr:hypothetical protein L1987_22596 [Smallanthus sonchifolius]
MMMENEYLADEYEPEDIVVNTDYKSHGRDSGSDSDVDEYAYLLKQEEAKTFKVFPGKASASLKIGKLDLNIQELQKYPSIEGGF